MQEIITWIYGCHCIHDEGIEWIKSICEALIIPSNILKQVLLIMQLIYD